MPKKAPTPTITHTEILARALQSIDREIMVWREKCEGLPEEHFKTCTRELNIKREALEKLYYIETGVEYD